MHFHMTVLNTCCGQERNAKFCAKPAIEQRLINSLAEGFKHFNDSFTNG
jgi:hypothetical protein